jgi:4-hydroxy-tetrahydrodipicolinate synthase
MDQPMQFKGTGVALVTPFVNGEIHWEGLERLIEHLIAGGINYLVSLGTTGESVTVSPEEQRAILDFTIKVNAGRLPVVAGVFGGNNTRLLTDKMADFNFDGIDALLCSNPAYNKPSQEGIYQHYMALAEASPRPIIIYNVPGRTASNMEADTTLRLAHASSKFVAVKEASDDIYQVSQIIKGRPDHFAVLSGDDFMSLPIIASGGHGVISVIGNALPKHFSSMVNAALEGDFARAQKLNLDLLNLYQQLFSEGNPAGIKAMLSLLGICGTEVRLPLVPMSAEGTAMLKKELDLLLS